MATIFNVPKNGAKKINPTQQGLQNIHFRCQTIQPNRPSSQL